MIKQHVSELKGRTQAVAKLFGCDRGVAAVEFGLFAPMLFFSLVTAADLGLALHERMTMDHILRSGAQQAMADAGVGNVLATMKAAADKHFSPCAEGATGNGAFCPSVTTQCSCPDGTPQVCATPVAACPNTYKKFYTISANKTRENMLLPSFTFSPSLKVQVH